MKTRSLIIIGSALVLSSFIIFTVTKIPVECVQFQPCISGDPAIPIWVQLDRVGTFKLLVIHPISGDPAIPIWVQPQFYIGTPTIATLYISTSIPIWVQPQFYIGTALIIVGLIKYFKNRTD